MPTYKYKTTIQGKVQSGEIEAESEQGALAKLKQRNINVTKVKKKSESAFLNNKKPITERDIVIFTRQFSTMVDAGLPLVPDELENVGDAEVFQSTAQGHRLQFSPLGVPEPGDVQRDCREPEENRGEPGRRSQVR